MSENSNFHILSVGWGYPLLGELFDRIACGGTLRFSHLLHPRYTGDTRPDDPPRQDVRFFRDQLRTDMPVADRAFLAALEADGVPTVHNMIMGDPVVAKLPYEDALAYATFLGKRLLQVIEEMRPSAVLVGFDGVHGSMALAVSRRLRIPCVALHFSVLPPGLACFCDRMSPAARVQLASLPTAELQILAAASLSDFRERRIQAAAYIAPPPGSILQHLRSMPERLAAVRRTLRKGRMRQYLRYTEGASDYVLRGALAHLSRTRRARRALASFPGRSQPPSFPYVLFGLHMQPESSIDVWAPFFSNQMWVIELLARSIPPTHRLLVKIHKSDAANYSREQLQRMQSLPGVELVLPFADSRRFIEAADLVVAIQGTMGLEAALLGKPTIMLGESAVTVFPSVASMGLPADLPALIRAQLARSAPSQEEIVSAYVSYLRPFLPASLNDWTCVCTDAEVDDYRMLFQALQEHVAAGGLNTSSTERRSA